MRLPPCFPDRRRRRFKMTRRRRGSEHVNHERWLISYADFITLLFAFFVVMFASSQTDKGKAQQVSESVKKALEGKSVSAVIAAVLGGSADNKGQGNAMMKGPGGANEIPKSKKDEKLAELLPSLKILTQELKTEIEAGRIQVSMEARGLVVSFTQAALFPSGEDVVSQDAYQGLERVAAPTATPPTPIPPSGNTDTPPTKNF